MLQLQTRVVRRLCLRMGFWMSVMVCASGEFASADVAPDPLRGGRTLQFRSQYGFAIKSGTDVQMVAETVQLRLTADRCFVNVSFRMKNTGDKSETFEVGFPADYRGELQKFRAAVDGKEIKPDDKQLWRTRSHGRSVWRTYWKIWEMTFPQDESVKIDVSYETDLSGKQIKNPSFLAQERYFPNLAYVDGAKAEWEEMKSRLIYRKATYILTTGRGWKGPIGRCDINVEFDGFKSENVILPLVPAGAQLHETGIRWRLKDLEPETNVSIAYTPNISRKESRELLERIHARMPDDLGIVWRLGGMYQAEGRPEAWVAVRLKILKLWQGRIALWGPEAEDEECLRQSRQVWDFIYRMSGVRGRTAESPGRETVMTTQRILIRLQDQLQRTDPDLPSRKVYSEMISQALAWCERELSKDEQ